MIVKLQDGSYIDAQYIGLTEGKLGWYIEAGQSSLSARWIDGVSQEYQTEKEAQSILDQFMERYFISSRRSFKLPR